MRTYGKVPNILSQKWVIWLIGIVLIYFSWNKFNEMYLNKKLDLKEKAAAPNANEEKFLSTNFKSCGGLGNVMFRGASIYGISKYLGRIPYFNYAIACLYNYEKEINSTFPNFFNFMAIKNPQPSDRKIVKFGNNVYEDPVRLKNESNKWIELTGKFLTSFKYFDKYDNEIKKMFEFHSNIVKSGEKFAKTHFRNDSSHKLCVYIRRGDFVKDKSLLESRLEFVIPSIKFVTKFLKDEDPNRKISLFFRGNDEKFINKIEINKKEYVAIYKSNPQNRGEDLYLGTRFCDSILLTTSISTFGYWMAYLKKTTDGYVFYNSQQRKIKPHVSDWDAFHWYPTTWIMLTQNRTNMEIFREFWNYTQFL